MLRASLLIAIVASGNARAAQALADAQTHDWHLGVNFRTDFGTHPLRIDGGVRWKQIDTILVLDPMFFTDGQHDIDLIAAWRFTEGWAAFFGWRPTSIGLADGRQWQEKTLLGIMGELPALFWGHVRGHWGFELAVLWVKHGGGLPTDTISSTRTIADYINFGMFVRFEYARGF